MDRRDAATTGQHLSAPASNRPPRWHILCPRPRGDATSAPDGVCRSHSAGGASSAVALPFVQTGGPARVVAMQGPTKQGPTILTSQLLATGVPTDRHGRKRGRHQSQPIVPGEVFFFARPLLAAPDVPMGEGAPKTGTPAAGTQRLDWLGIGCHSPAGGGRWDQADDRPWTRGSLAVHA